MALGTYAELKASVLKDLLRSSDTDADTTFNDWLKKFEAHARRELAQSVLGEMVQQAATISSEYTTLPDDLIGIRQAAITVGGSRFLLRAMTPQAMDEEYGVDEGQPFGYCIVGNSLRVAPVPDGVYTVRLVCCTLPALTSTATTNWLLTGAPDLYEAGCLWKAQEYYKSDEALVLETRVDKAIARLIKQAKLNLPTAGMVARISGGIV